MFLRAFRGLRYFDARAKLSTWIYTITHRVVIDHVRAAGRRPLECGRDAMIRMSRSSTGSPR